jgi:lysophospholipase L1-like esterase
LPLATAESNAKAASNAPAPLELTAEADHRAMMRELGITSLRPGADPNDPQSPHAVNYDEARANPYPTLPDPLVTEDGEAVTSAEMWWSKRRPEIVELFDREVYGRVPANAPRVDWEVASTTREEKFGIPVVTKKLVGRVDNSAYPAIEVTLDLTLTTPTEAAGPVPVMLEFGFNFPPEMRRRFATQAAASGVKSPDWQELLLKKGWGYAVLIPTSIQADNGAGLTQGIIGLVNRGQRRKPEDWGALRAWAWGASRALDYFETDPAVDAKQVGIEGLSRYGKAALVAMAYDPRFAIGFIGSSGEGGAKLHRRTFGELVENLTGSGEYHWMAGNFLKYGGPMNAGDLPVDAHELIALCAPRPVFISYGASTGPGAEGQWLDQRGSFLATVAAGPVYRLLGKKDLGTDEYPAVEAALVEGELAWRQHRGGHTTGPNWPTFLAWADRYIQGPAAAKKSAGSESATDKYGGAWAAEPAPQENPLFAAAHEMLLKKRTEGVIDVYFLGDSITRRWQGTDYPEHRKNWDANFHGWNAANFGWGGDTTRNVLWRLDHGELDGVNPQVVVLLVGTNNLGNTPPEDVDARAADVAQGVRAILDRVRERAPAAKVVLMGVLPRNDATNAGKTVGEATALMPTIDAINARIEKFADGETIVFLNINDKLADADGKLLPGVTEDGLHLSVEGYQVWADALKPLLTKWLGPRAQEDQGPPASGVPVVGK